MTQMDGKQQDAEGMSRDLNAQYVSSATRGLLIKTEQKMQVGWDHGMIYLM